jgi:geranylgeranylglycerol-phosphate geranylgeranyltransferase
MSASSSLRNLVLLTRPHNGLIAAASVLVGSFLARGSVTPSVVAASGMTFLVCSGAYALNDVYDLETDRLNRPARPLASRAITPRLAVGLAMALWALGALVVLFGPAPAGAFFLAWTGLLWLYSWKVKALGWAGHLLVSTVASSGLMLGAELGGNWRAGIIPVGIAFLFHLTREIAKSIADLPGDRSAGLLTVAVRVGEGRAWSVLIPLTGAAVGLSLFPFITGVYGRLYFLPTAAVIYPILGVCLWKTIRARRGSVEPRQAADSVAKMLKATMPVGLVAFLLAGV